MTRIFDVAIVGGGLVGATLAAALDRLRLSVAWIDPEPEGKSRGDARSLAISCGSARFYRRLGLWDAVAAEASPIGEVHVSRRGHFGAARLRASDAGVEALGYVLPANLLLEGLDAAARACERVHAEARAVELRDGTALVTANGVRGDAALAARLVVGADGTDSVVRHSAGLALRIHRCTDVAVAGSLVPERPHCGRAFERFTGWGPLALLPLAGGRCGFIWALPEPVAERFTGACFAERLAAAFGGRLGALRQVEVRVRHPLRVCHAPRVTAGRTVLVGNAANALHPVGAQGFNLGVRDVEALHAQLEKAAWSGADPGLGLRRYASARRADHRLARALTGGLLRVFGSRLPFAPALGAAGLFAFDRLPAAKRRFLRLATGSRESYDGGVRAPPSPG